VTPLELLEASFAFTRTKIDGTRDAPLDAPTPCSEWTLQQLLNHTIASADGFASIVDGSVAEFDVESWAETPFAGDAVAAYDAAVAHALSAFGAPGAFERVVSIGPNEAPVSVLVYPCAGDALLHGWDLATATGQDAEIPEAPGAEVLVFVEQNLGDGPRPGFAAAVPVPDDAPVGQRLVASSGRRP
jgi:uncharacterized protein (TIGR03086 family)